MMQAHTAGSFCRLILQAHTAGSYCRLILQAHTAGSYCRAHTAGSYCRLILQAHTVGYFCRKSQVITIILEIMRHAKMLSYFRLIEALLTWEITISIVHGSLILEFRFS